MFILSTDLPDPVSHIFLRRQRERRREYRAHLERIGNRLPPTVREYALAEWGEGGRDPHGDPHGAWLESASVRELAPPDDVQLRRVEVAIRLHGPFHDGHIEFTYRDVLSYCLDLPHRADAWKLSNRGHDDWAADEVRLSERGKVLHEIEWAARGNWIVEAESFEYRWLPAAAGRD